MLVLLDQATPVMIRKSLAGHGVETAAQRGWDKLKNGELLAVAEAVGFQVFITPDKTFVISRISPSARWPSSSLAMPSGPLCDSTFNS